MIYCINFFALCDSKSCKRFPTARGKDDVEREQERPVQNTIQWFSQLCNISTRRKIF